MFLAANAACVAFPIASVANLVGQACCPKRLKKFVTAFLLIKIAPSYFSKAGNSQELFLAIIWKSGKAVTLPPNAMISLFKVACGSGLVFRMWHWLIKSCLNIINYL